MEATVHARSSITTIPGTSSLIPCGFECKRKKNVDKSVYDGPSQCSHPFLSKANKTYLGTPVEPCLLPTPRDVCWAARLLPHACPLVQVRRHQERRCQQWDVTLHLLKLLFEVRISLEAVPQSFLEGIVYVATSLHFPPRNKRELYIIISGSSLTPLEHTSTSSTLTPSCSAWSNTRMIVGTSSTADPCRTTSE